jgi:hypothetical protein
MGRKTWLTHPEHESEPTCANLVAVIQRGGRAWLKPVAIQQSIVRAVEVFDHILTAGNGDFEVASRYAALFAAVRGQVDIGKDAAIGVLTAYDGLFVGSETGALRRC